MSRFYEPSNFTDPPEYRDYPDMDPDFERETTAQLIFDGELPEDIPGMLQCLWERYCEKQWNDAGRFA